MSLIVLHVRRISTDLLLVTHSLKVSDRTIENYVKFRTEKVAKNAYLSQVVCLLASSALGSLLVASHKTVKLLKILISQRPQLSSL